MKTRRLLYLTAQQMIVTRWRSGQLEQEGIFAANELGYAQFAESLREHPDETYTLLANVPDEGFQIETIPFLQGADRQTVIKRKLGQVFFNAPLTATLSLGYEKTSRKDERLLLAALTNQEQLAPWLNALSAAAVPISGIYSLSLLAPPLLRRLGPCEKQCLLLTLQDQSIRQSYLEDGHVHFSRLTPLHSLSDDGIAHTFAAETARLQQYLNSQRILARDQAITVFILAHPDASSAINKRCVDTETIRFVILDFHECAKITGLRSLSPDSSGESLFLHLAVTTPPRIQFAGEDLRHAFHLKRIRHTLYAIGAAALVGCLTAAAILLHDVTSIHHETDQLRQEALLTQRRYDEVVKAIPPIPASNETLGRVIDRYTDLEKRNLTPDGLYREISRALQMTPDIELDGIEWLTGDRETKNASSPASTPASATIPPDHEAALVRGVLSAGNSSTNPRQMLAVFDQFVATLKSNPALTISVSKRPFDIESGKTLRNEDANFEDRKPRTFSLQIMRKIGS